MAQVSRESLSPCWKYILSCPRWVTAHRRCPCSVMEPTLASRQLDALQTENNLKSLLLLLLPSLGIFILGTAEKNLQLSSYWQLPGTQECRIRMNFHYSRSWVHCQESDWLRFKVKLLWEVTAVQPPCSFVTVPCGDLKRSSDHMRGELWR